MNIVKTGDGRFIEVQGTAEAIPFGRDALLRCSTSPTSASSSWSRSRRAHRPPGQETVATINAEPLNTQITWSRFSEFCVAVGSVMQLSRTILPTPLGDMLALVVGRGAVRARVHDGEGTRARRGAVVAARRAAGALVSAARDRRPRDAGRSRGRGAGSTTYFAGAAADISGLPLDMRGAPFEQRVWVALRSDSAGPDHQLRRDRAGARIARRLARGRRRQRRQPDRDHRPLPPRDRIERIADRLRRRPRPQDLADRPRTPLAHASRRHRCSKHAEQSFSDLRDLVLCILIRIAARGSDRLSSLVSRGCSTPAARRRSASPTARPASTDRAG